MSAIDSYKKNYKKFNHEFFDDKLPEVDIQEGKQKDKDAVGSFNYSDTVSYSLNGHTDKVNFMELKKKIFNKSASDSDKNIWDSIVSQAYISLPKEAYSKGIYYYNSILLHEMTHVWQRLVSDSYEKEPHGKDFKKKVDEINKKSKDEWRVSYETLSPVLSDKDAKYDKRPELDENTYKSIYYDCMNDDFTSIYNESNK